MRAFLQRYRRLEACSCVDGVAAANFKIRTEEEDFHVAVAQLCASRARERRQLSRRRSTAGC